MLTGVEIITPEFGAYERDRAIRTGARLFRVRKPEQIALILEALPEARFLCRNPGEGVDLGDVINGYHQWLPTLRQYRSRILAYQPANEPNVNRAIDPDHWARTVGPWLASLDCPVPLCSPGLARYQRRQAWEAALRTIPWAYTGKHIYWQQDGPLAAIEDLFADVEDPSRVIVSEINAGHASPDYHPDTATRAAEVATAARALAERGVAAMVLFAMTYWQDWGFSYTPSVIAEILQAGQAPAESPQETPTMTDKMQGRRMAMIWQFNQLPEQTVPEIAARLRASGIDAVCFKAADGTAFPTQFRHPDTSPLAIGSADDVAARVAEFEAAGIAAGAWVNVTRGSWTEQAQVHAAIAAASGWLALDLEPYEEFLGAYPDPTGVALYLNTLIDTTNAAIGENWGLAGMPDPRPARLNELRWELWRDRLTCVYPQVYWTDFQRPWREVLDEAQAALGHHDVRALLPATATMSDLTAALEHPICAGGAGLWRLPASDWTLAAFGDPARIPAELQPVPEEPPESPTNHPPLAHLDAVYGHLQTIRAELDAAQAELLNLKAAAGL